MAKAWTFAGIGMLMVLVVACGGGGDDDDSGSDDDTPADDDGNDDADDDDLTDDDTGPDDDTQPDDDTADDDTQPPCVDEDGDTRGENCPAGTDCNDEDPDNWVSCDSCLDADEDGAYAGCDAYETLTGPDCDDQDAGRFPGNVEMCNGADDACSGGVPANETDSDGDGFVECIGWTGFRADPDVIAGGDCDDTDPMSFPGAPERCDGNDNACLGDVPVTETDRDGDGFAACAGWDDAQGDDGEVDGGNDCDDTDDAVFPDGYSCGGEFFYVENFDTGNGGWYGVGTPNSWEWGAPAATFISSAPTSPNAWVTNLDGAYNNSESSWLVPPEFDFSGISQDPTLAFDLIYNTESCCDEGYVDISFDQGGTWSRVGASGTGQNWYNDGVNQWWDGNSPGWVRASNTLTGAAGQPSVQLLWRFASDSSVTYEGFGVDSVSISSVEAASVAVETVDVGGNDFSCAYDDEEVITVEISFAHLPAPLTEVALTYSVNGEPAVSEVVDASGDPLESGDTLVHDFAVGADLTSQGIKIIAVEAAGAGTGYEFVARGSDRVINQGTVSDFPYFEDFEGAFNGWVAMGNTSFEWGAPAGSVINTAWSGSKVWTTDLDAAYRNNEFGFVVSPCLDFSAFGAVDDEDPILSLARRVDAETSYDGARVDYTVDQGLNWVTVGDVGTGVNWYTDNTCNGLTQGPQVCWTGSAGEWALATHTLGDLRDPLVQMRVVFGSEGSVTYDGFAFDDVSISTPQTDLAPTAVIVPADVCAANSATPVAVEITSAGGIFAGGVVDVMHRVGAGILVEESANVPFLAYGGTYQYTFTTGADFSYYEEPKFTVTVTVPNDVDTTNDVLEIRCD
ncbi:MAG: hypothetical protein IT350_05550 [Deltaproteobacteria bacterium]|nr:hypothetical protein [Deltaproteobacteria bacterium]